MNRFHALLFPLCFSISTAVLNEIFGRLRMAAKMQMHVTAQCVADAISFQQGLLTVAIGNAVYAIYRFRAAGDF